MIIDCNECEMQNTPHCKDCFVMAVISNANQPIEMDDEEQHAVTYLQEAGLAPVIKFKKKAG
ncbi:MAG: hypothetical protein ABR507_05965 [Actinomycetota bacterium]|nr:hypothetical protein [Actinomycetota bacterium]